LIINALHLLFYQESYGSIYYWINKRVIYKELIINRGENTKPFSKKIFCVEK